MQAMLRLWELRLLTIAPLAPLAAGMELGNPLGRWVPAERGGKCKFELDTAAVSRNQ